MWWRGGAELTERRAYPPLPPTTCSAWLSFGSCQASAQADEECACCPVKNVRKSLAAAEAVAEQGGEPSEAQTPQGASSDEAQPQRDERGKFGGAISHDELGHQGEKEQSYFRIKGVRKQPLSIHSPKAR